MGYTHGEHWNDEKIAEGILFVCDALKISRMPSRNEIRDFYGNDRLTNRISKTKGYYGWADTLGLSIKQSETTIGKTYEEVAKELLEARGYNVSRMSQNFPYDLLVNGTVKIDVKVSHVGKSNGFACHTFGLSKKSPTCDIYMLFALNSDCECERLLIVPSVKAKIVTMCIGADSKYNRYIDRWDLIEQYARFMESVV